MKRLRRYLGPALVVALLAGITSVIVTQMPQRSALPQGPGSRLRADAPVPVLAATARTADVPVYLDGIGTARALNTVTVRPQVDGKIISINFKEGQDVTRGDVLARIDPAVYQAQLNQAIAKKAQDEALLANARIDLERYTRLAKTNAATQQQADTQRALVAQLEAQVQADQAAIENARTYLDYTTITAPLSGRTGMRLVDVGNIVRAADSTGIVVITQVRPIAVLFTLPQQQLGRVNQAMAKGRPMVEALGNDGRTLIDRGLLQVVDNQVDQATGTIRLKAEFPNEDLQLWPGQFVNVRLLVDTLRDAVVVPTAAVQRGPTGTFVYVIKEGDTVAVRPVTVAQQDDTHAVIAAGLTPAERVVTTGFSQLRDGSRVSVGGTPSTEMSAGELQGSPNEHGSAPSVPVDASGARRRERAGGGTGAK